MKSILASLGLFVSLGCCALTGCATDTTLEGVSGSQSALSFNAGQKALVLAFVNDEATTFELLDDEVALDKRAASNIIAHRNGPDTVFPSGDDDLFGDLEELDAISYVGPVALSKILAYATANPPPAGELVEGVNFSGGEAQAVIAGVNLASVSELDHAVGLDRRAAQNLVAAAPYASVTEMGPIGYVGASALTKLRSYAAVWKNEAGYAGTFDGVSFDAVTAATVLEIVNQSTVGGLMTQGMWTKGAITIVDHRPYNDLGEVAATSGIGSATMSTLHAIASAWPWEMCELNSQPSSIAAIDSYVQGLLAHDYCAPYGQWHIAAFDAACIDLSDPSHIEALRQMMISVSPVWPNWTTNFPQMFEYGPVVSGAGAFQSKLNLSLTWLAEQIGTNHPDYANLAVLQAQILSLTNANPSASYSMQIHLEASEASEDAYLFVDVESGLIIVMHRGWGC
jgi:DNA uptake protein ComE-like DNA-binding protein